MKITISGAVGSGKSTVSKILAEKLGYKRYSMGDFMRQIAVKRDMNIMEISKRAEADPTIDEELDKTQEDIGRKEKDFIMDSRLGFHFIPDSLKIFLNVDVKEAAKRIFNQGRKEERYTSIKEAERYVKKRMQSENMRYKEYYGLDFPKREYFDLILDTTSKSPEEIAKDILKHVK